jgi:hypothetical protein
VVIISTADKRIISGFTAKSATKGAFNGQGIIPFGSVETICKDISISPNSTVSELYGLNLKSVVAVTVCSMSDCQSLFCLFNADC